MVINPRLNYQPGILLIYMRSVGKVYYTIVG